MHFVFESLKWIGIVWKGFSHKVPHWWMWMLESACNEYQLSLSANHHKGLWRVRGLGYWPRRCCLWRHLLSRQTALMYELIAVFSRVYDVG